MQVWCTPQCVHWRKYPPAHVAFLFPYYGSEMGTLAAVACSVGGENETVSARAGWLLELRVGWVSLVHTPPECWRADDGDCDTGPLSPRCGTSACTLDGWGSSGAVCACALGWEVSPRLSPPAAAQQVHPRVQSLRLPSASHACAEDCLWALPLL